MDLIKAFERYEVMIAARKFERKTFAAHITDWDLCRMVRVGLIVMIEHRHGVQFALKSGLTAQEVVEAYRSLMRLSPEVVFS